MSILFAIIVVILLAAITGLLVDILGELRLAKSDRDFDRAERDNQLDPRYRFDEEE